MVSILATFLLLGPFFSCQFIPFLPVNLTLVALPDTSRLFLHFVALFLFNQRLLFLDHFFIKLLFPFVQFVLELLTLIFVGVCDRVEIDVLASLKAVNLASKNFLDTWKAEEEE